MRVAVITLVHGRHTHLRRQAEGLRAGSRVPDLHVVVAMDDPGVPALVPDAVVVPLEADERGLPLAAARNAGVAAARARGAELLVLLDVDCIPGPDLVARYAAAGVDGLLCGPVAYLPPAGPDGYPLPELDRLATPHPARPVPRPGEVLPVQDPDLFWSLSFACTPSTWDRVGGFCDRYAGYGAEDTDFARSAASAGVPMWWVGGAVAYHQDHGPSGATADHLDDLLRNGRVFAERWGRWPMTGWFEELQQQGLVRRDGDGWAAA